jgi:hypothetical protein
MSSAVSLKDILRDGKLFEFKASEPLRYLALVVARFTRVSEVDLTLPDTFAASAGIDKLTLAVEAQSSQRFRGRTVAQQTKRSCGSTHRSSVTSRTSRRRSH